MSDDFWLPVIDQADIEAALQRKKSRDSRLVEQEAEITRLRAELATARRKGMEEAAKIAAGSYPDESRYDPRSPLYGMDLNPDRSEFGRGKEAGRKEAAAAILAAAKEVKP